MDQLPRFCSVFACLPLAWFGVQALARASKCEDPSDEGTGGAPGFFVIIIIIIIFFCCCCWWWWWCYFFESFPWKLGEKRCWLSFLLSFLQSLYWIQQWTMSAPTGWRWDFEVEPYFCTIWWLLSRPFAHFVSCLAWEDWKTGRRKPFLSGHSYQHSCMWCVGSYLHWGFRVWDANWDKESRRGKVQRLRSIRQFVRKLRKFVKTHKFLMDSPEFSMVWPGNGFQFTIWNVRSICTRLWVWYGWHMKPFTQVLPHLPKPLASRRSGWGGLGTKRYRWQVTAQPFKVVNPMWADILLSLSEAVFQDTVKDAHKLWA